ncbi:hypothetical protein GCM10017562_13710 [Streptomyces roseofulvus]|uniref:hypothetical protein n=1 Tax=Streptomyces roseofulvus TaxID=33902 RepID=UPI0031F7C68C
MDTRTETRNVDEILWHDRTLCTCRPVVVTPGEAALEEPDEGDQERHIVRGED